jgi:hypothetical protein
VELRPECVLTQCQVGSRSWGVHDSVFSFAHPAAVSMYRLARLVSKERVEIRGRPGRDTGSIVVPYAKCDGYRHGNFAEWLIGVDLLCIFAYCS